MPTLLVVGLHGWILPPGAILVCDLFVYSEFLIHPVLLLISSTKMRKEIMGDPLRRFMVRFLHKMKTEKTSFTAINMLLFSGPYTGHVQKEMVVY